MSDDATTFDHEVTIGTDSAEIALLDPARLLEHRYEPFGWQYTAGATLADRRAGQLLRFDTGSDGGYGVRVTDGPLRPRESSRAAASAVLRLHVGASGVLLDGGYAWPSEDDPHIDESYGVRLAVPSGDYAATITAIARSVDASGRYLDIDSDEGPVADYVIRLQAVDDLTTVPMMLAVPVLTPLAKPSTRPFESMSRFDERCEEIPSAAIPVTVGDGSLPPPGGHWSGPVPLALYEYIRERDSSFDVVSSVEASGFFLILTPAATPGAVGTVVKVSGWSHLSGRDGSPGLARASGRTLCAARIGGPASSKITLASLADVATVLAVEPVPLDATAGDDRAISDALVDTYREWLRRSGRKDVSYQLAAIDEAWDARHRFAQIVSLGQPPAARVSKWLDAPAKTRDRALTRWLKQHPGASLTLQEHSAVSKGMSRPLMTRSPGHERGKTGSKDRDRMVSQRSDGKWQNKRHGASRATSVHRTQAEAQDAARANLKNQGGGELTTLGKNGQIRGKNTVAPGNDLDLSHSVDTPDT